jgi:hypothetical protein
LIKSLDRCLRIINRIGKMHFGFFSNLSLFSFFVKFHTPSPYGWRWWGEEKKSFFYFALNVDNFHWLSFVWSYCDIVNEKKLTTVHFVIKLSFSSIFFIFAKINTPSPYEWRWLGEEKKSFFIFDLNVHNFHWLLSVWTSCAMMNEKKLITVYFAIKLSFFKTSIFHITGNIYLLVQRKLKLYMKIDKISIKPLDRCLRIINRIGKLHFGFFSNLSNFFSFAKINTPSPYKWRWCGEGKKSSLVIICVDFLCQCEWKKINITTFYD